MFISERRNRCMNRISHKCESERENCYGNVIALYHENEILTKDEQRCEQHKRDYYYQ